MAQKTARDRWPKLVQSMIDDVQQQESTEQGKEKRSIIEGLEALQRDIANNQRLM